MPSGTKPSALRRSPHRHIFVSEEDVNAGQTTLKILAGGNGPSQSGNAPPQFTGGARHRNQMLQRAREMFALRERRLQAFSFSAEAPFILLLALYANEEWEPSVTLTRLNQLARLPPATGFRWLEVLVEQGWVQRNDDASDGRKILVSLSAVARAKLDELLGDQPVSAT